LIFIESKISTVVLHVLRIPLGIADFLSLFN